MSSTAVVKFALCDNDALSGHTASQPTSANSAETIRAVMRTGANGTSQATGNFNWFRQTLARFLPLLAALTVLAAASCSPNLSTAPRLVASWPAAGATLSLARQTLELTFNDRLRSDGTWAAIRNQNGSELASSTTLDANDARRLEIRISDPAAGSYQLHWHVVSAETQLASDGEQIFAMQEAASAPPRIDISPARTDTGQPLEIVGKGFARASHVQLSIGDDKQPLATLDTDDRGTFNTEVRVPASVPFGVQPLAATDAAGRMAVGSVEVRWGGWPPAVATNIGQPGPGSGEFSFTLNVRNRSDYTLEHVRVVMQDPEGSSVVSATPEAQREGSTLVWLVPVMPRGPAGPFQVTYAASAPAVSHAWLEFRHRLPRGCTGDDCLPAFISVSTADSEEIAPATSAH